VQGVQWNSSYCFDPPNVEASQGIITIRGVTSCAKSSTNKRFGPGCTAFIYIEADGEILQPTLQYWDFPALAYQNFPIGCFMTSADPTKQSSTKWTMTCAGSAAVLLPQVAPHYDLKLKTSNIRDAAGNTFSDITTDMGYKGTDILPIIIDNTPPATSTVDVPQNCNLVIGDVTTITATFDEASSRPTFYAFDVQVNVANILSSPNGTQNGFHNTWNATITVPSGWTGVSPIMPWVVTNAEDDVGNVDSVAYVNTAGISGTALVTNTTNATCLIDAEPPVILSVSCGPSQVVKQNSNVTVTFVTNEAIQSPGTGCVYVSGVAAVATNPSADGVTWEATVTIPPDACDGEVSLRVCALTDTGVLPYCCEIPP
jgi:hypothetical protein